MPLIDRVLLRFGLVRLSAHRLVLLEDGRVVPGPELADDDWEPLPPAMSEFAFGTAKEQPYQPRIARGTEPAPLVRAEDIDGTEDGEWEARVRLALARASAEDARNGQPNDVRFDTQVTPVIPEERGEEDWEWRIAIAKSKTRSE